MVDLKVDGATTAPQAGALAGHLAPAGKDDFSKYAGFEAGDAVTDDSMAALKSLAEDLLNRERELAVALAAVVTAKAALAEVQEVRLPDMMQKHNLPKFTFRDRTTNLDRVIELIEKWAVSLPPITGKTKDPDGVNKRRKVYAWLRSIGSGAIVKKTVEADVGTLDDAATLAIAEAIKAANPDIEVAIDERVEAVTLTALISRRKDKGDEVHENIITKPVREARVKGSA